MSDITREEVSKKIKETDRLFDGYYSELGLFIQDREFAYNHIRLMIIELADEFLGDSE